MYIIVYECIFLLNCCYIVQFEPSACFLYAHSDKSVAYTVQIKKQMLSKCLWSRVLYNALININPTQGKNKYAVFSVHLNPALAQQGKCI